MPDDILPDRQVDEFRNESNTWILMYEKACSMLDMNILNSSFFCQIECKPGGWCESNMREDIFRIILVNSIKNLPKILLPKTGKWTVLHGFNYKKIFSSSKCYHFLRK